MDLCNAARMRLLTRFGQGELRLTRIERFIMPPQWGTVVAPGGNRRGTRLEARAVRGAE